MNQGSPAVDILGVPIHRLSEEETLRRLEEMALSGTPHHVMTVNPEFVMMARENEEFRNVLVHADLALPDGMGILWASRILGRPLKERIAGVDIVTRFAGVAARKGIRTFLLGAAEGVAEKVAALHVAANPGLGIAGTFAGSPSPADEEDICRRIGAAHPHALFVAYGPPRQDLWIARTRERLRVPLAIGVGGTFDFIAGVVPRAPLWMQRGGLEWLYRLMKEPRRWRRMLSLPRFAAAVIGTRLSGRHA